MPKLYAICDSFDQADITIQQFRDSLVKYFAECNEDVLHTVATLIIEAHNYNIEEG